MANGREMLVQKIGDLKAELKGMTGFLGVLDASGRGTIRSSRVDSTGGAGFENSNQSCGGDVRFQISCGDSSSTAMSKSVSFAPNRLTDLTRTGAEPFSLPGIGWTTSTVAMSPNRTSFRDR